MMVGGVDEWCAAYAATAAADDDVINEICW